MYPIRMLRPPPRVPPKRESPRPQCFRCPGSVTGGCYHGSVQESHAYQVKGLLYQATKAYFDAHVEGGQQALVEALPPDLQEFMSQPFVAGGLYDCMVVPELITHEARVCALPRAEYLDRRTRWQASRDLSGVYKLIARVAPVNIVVSRMVVLMTQMFTFGDAKLDRVGPGHLRAEVVRVPEPLGDWLQQCVGIYADACLQLAAGRGYEIAAPGHTAEAPENGQAMCTLHFDITWQ